MEKIVIIGASGHAKVIIDSVERENQYEIVGILDTQQSTGSHFFGYTVLGNEQELPSLVEKYSISGGIVAIGNNRLRSTVVARILDYHPGFKFRTVVHPAAIVSKTVNIGQGSVIMPGAIINADCTLGMHCILNTNCSLDHDSTVGDFSSLAPGVITGGTVRIKSHVTIGIGATLIQGLNIGSGATIGAGSTVLHDVEQGALVYGTPAKTIG